MIAIVTGITVIVVVSGIIIFNQLIRYKMLVREALSGIDVQLKRRHDLIPKIVDVVKGYVQYERTLLEKVTTIRSQASNPLDIKEKGRLENGLSTALKSLFALKEAYPDLKANSNFSNLQATISEIEDQIQMARRYYNGTVRNYNVSIETFPGNLLAGAFKFKPSDFFEIEYSTERKSPDIEFSSQQGRPTKK